MGRILVLAGTAIHEDGFQCFLFHNINDYPQSYHQRDRNAVFALVTEGTSVASTPG